MLWRKIWILLRFTLTKSIDLIFSYWFGSVWGLDLWRFLLLKIKFQRLKIGFWKVLGQDGWRNEIRNSEIDITKDENILIAMELKKKQNKNHEKQDTFLTKATIISMFSKFVATSKHFIFNQFRIRSKCKLLIYIFKKEKKQGIALSCIVSVLFFLFCILFVQFWGDRSFVEHLDNSLFSFFWNSYLWRSKLKKNENKYKIKLINRLLSYRPNSSDRKKLYQRIAYRLLKIRIMLKFLENPQIKSSRYNFFISVKLFCSTNFANFLQ